MANEIYRQGIRHETRRFLEDSLVGGFNEFFEDIDMTLGLFYRRNRFKYSGSYR